ncbi:MFS transporter [candidate division KSB1 bacterium]|nr:MFS transporter [candidate division KSB1 bacterium]
MRRFHTARVFLISVVHLCHDIYSSFLAPLLPLLIDKLGFSYSLAGLLPLAQRLPSLLNPFIGIVADRAGIRYLIIAAPAITAVSMSLLGMASSYGVLVILLLIMGIGSAFWHVPAPVMVKKVSGGQVGKGMSIYMVGGEAARTLGPIAILTAVSVWGLEGTYRLIPVGFLASLALWLSVKDLQIGIHHPPQDVAQTTKTFTPFFLVIAALLLFRACAKTAMTLFLPTFLTHQGSTLWSAGISLSILQAAGAAGTLVAGWLSDRIGKNRVLYMTTFAGPVAVSLFLLSTGVLRVVFLIFSGIALFAATPVLLALVQEKGQERPAFMNGIFMTINFIVSSLIAVFVGLLGDHFGLNTAFWISGLLSIAAIPFVWLLARLS